jgi:hypothetical protein
MTLRQDLVSTLSEIGFIPIDATPSSPALNTSSENLNLIKAVILGGLWPRVARIHLPKESIKFDKVSAGTIQRDNAAKDFKIYDLQEGRVFLHPGSLLFDTTNWRPPFLTYFLKQLTSKVFLRDASKVRLPIFLPFQYTRRILAGANLRPSPIWRACLSESCPRWTLYREQRQLHQSAGDPSHWNSRQSTEVPFHCLRK